MHKSQADLSTVGPAKVDANTRKLRPDKCLVVKSLDSSLRPVALRNMESTAITTRKVKAERQARFLGCLGIRSRAGAGNHTAQLLALSRREPQQRN